MKFSLQLEPLHNWLGQEGKPIIISGPCSAETPEQVMETALGLKAGGQVDLLRAGIWKPRTRPDSFQGVGEQGLEWLVNAGRETGLPVVTEVARASHVEACLKAGIDMIWIGARTTVNPFSVQEIADALQGVDIPVWVKNPINPDLPLWLGALERFNRAGITKLGAIHRGFSYYKGNGYRNAPQWDIPIELQTLCPELPLICDPSHIGGKRQYLAEISQKALDLGMAGLMLESHPNPDKAWSDAAQQVTPVALGELVDQLVVRKPGSTSIEFASQLELLRSVIDEIDDQLLRKLAERMEVVSRIGEYKRENNVTILQLERWREILETRTSWGEGMDLTPEFVRSLLKAIHKASISLQTDILNSEPADESEAH